MSGIVSVGPVLYVRGGGERSDGTGLKGRALITRASGSGETLAKVYLWQQRSPSHDEEQASLKRETSHFAIIRPHASCVNGEHGTDAL